MLFKPLAHTDSPMLGLFYMEHEAKLEKRSRVNLAVDRPLTAGIASLVSSDGIAVTCAHVILALDARPGTLISLFGATASVSIEVHAEVLHEGWRGPVLDEYGARMPNPFWSHLWDSRPDVFREDLAFLRVLPETARWHLRTEAKPPPPRQSAFDAFVQAARVLPVSQAGYRKAGAQLTAWCVAWIQGAPDCHPAAAEFKSADSEGHHPVRVETTFFRPGFSGGPLWDERRRVVVGLVRRALPAMGSVVLCTDGLALCAHPSVKLSPDLRLYALQHHIQATLETTPGGRYANLGANGDDPSYIEPQIARVLGQADPLGNRPEQVPLPAVAFLADHLGTLKRLVLRGAAGIGKTMLVKHLAATLLARADQGGGTRMIPVVLTAAELVANGVDVATCMEALWLAARPSEVKDDVVDVLAENGATLALLIDGIDEISDQDRVTVLSRLDIRRQVRPRVARFNDHSDGFDGLVAATLVTTRPSERWEASGRDLGPIPRFHLYDLLRFDQDRIDAFCKAVVTDAELRAAFRSALLKARWGKDHATPLQLQMAASLFAWQGELPPRSVDLTAIFVKLSIDRACTEFLAKADRRLRDEVRDIYVPSAQEILAFVASVTLKTRADTITKGRFIEELEASSHLPWVRNIGSIVEFVYHEFTSYLPLINYHEESGHIEWAHRTFAELLGAEHIVMAQSSATSLRDRLFEMLEHGHGPALSLLGVVDRAGDDAVSEDILRRCMSNEYGSSRPQLFAIRALGAGLDARGRTRKDQVKLLIRYLVSDVRERGLCIHLFASEDLPDARELLAYPELREDLFQVMLDRFRPRMARALPGRHVAVMARESTILKHANLWPEFLEMGLRRPPSDEAPYELPDAIAARPIGDANGGIQGSTAHIVIHDSDGSMRALSIPAADFITSLAHAARHSSPQASAAELVNLTVEIRLAELRDDRSP